MESQAVFQAKSQAKKIYWIATLAASAESNPELNRNLFVNSFDDDVEAADLETVLKAAQQRSNLGRILR